VLLVKLRSKRAVSTVIATLIMIDVAVALGVMAYLYSQNMLGTLSSNYNIYFERNKQIMQKRVSMVNVRFQDTGAYKFNITIVNSGSIHVSVAAIYVNGSDILPYVSDAWNFTSPTTKVRVPSPNGQYLIAVGDGVTFAFRLSPTFYDPWTKTVKSMTYGKLYMISVVTSDGVSDVQYWTATKGA
jgi:archaellum component FlaF (FlaF/FlaG flagellin family)